jgi:hypothetical protein
MRAPSNGLNPSSKREKIVELRRTRQSFALPVYVLRNPKSKNFYAKVVFLGPEIDWEQNRNKKITLKLDAKLGKLDAQNN